MNVGNSRMEVVVLKDWDAVIVEVFLVVMEDCGYGGGIF